MPELVLCEFRKLKRKRAPGLALLSSVLFPLFYARLLPDETLAVLMGSVREDSGFLLLLPILVMLAAHLFFLEHDCDTLKNLACIPVPKSRLALAKALVLLLFAVAYALCGAAVCVPLALAQGIPLERPAFQLLLTLGTGVLLWAAALPCVVLVVWCNRSYILSVMIAFFYTLLNFALHLSDAVMLKPLGLNLNTFLPVPVIFRWLYQFKEPEGQIMTDFYNRFRPYFVSTPAVFLILLAEAAVCIGIAAAVYQTQEV